MTIKMTPMGIALAMFLIAGCMDKDISKDTPGDDTNTFDYRTANDVVANVSYDIPEGYQVFFEAYSENPIETVDGESVKKESIKYLFKGFTDKNGIYSELVQIPSSIKNLYLYTNATGVPTVTTYNINGKQTVAKSTLARAGGADYIYSTCPAELKIMKDGHWNAIGVPDYLGTNQEIQASALKMIDATLGNNSISLNNYIAESGETNINIIKDGATVDIVLLHNGGNTVTNTMGYYYYNTQNPPRTAEDIKKIVLFPNATCSPKGGLQPGNSVRLSYWDETTKTWKDQFPKGITIGWFMLVGGFNTPTQEINKPDIWRVYAYSNTELNASPKKLNVIVRDPKTKIRYIGFEDKNFTQADYRDLIFYINADPTSIEYNDGNKPDGKDITDTDGDGVADVDDEFPNDPALAYTVKYEGTVAFEDIWPYQGDYDMNDMVMGYKSTHYLSARNLIVKVEDQWTLKHVGAQYINGFGYQYGLGTNRISKVTKTSAYTTPTKFSMNTKGLENNQTNATVILFDNATDVEKTGKEMTFIVETVLGGVKASELGLPPYNPFIIIETDKGRGHEVHLPNYKPTDLMEMKLLHYGNDLSDPIRGLYFISNNKFPFAIHVVGSSFDFPKVEGQRIDNVFPQYSGWVTSNGTENQEWYKHKK